MNSDTVEINNWWREEAEINNFVPVANPNIVCHFLTTSYKILSMDYCSLQQYIAAHNSYQLFYYCLLLNKTNLDTFIYSVQPSVSTVNQNSCTLALLPHGAMICTLIASGTQKNMKLQVLVRTCHEMFCPQSFSSETLPNSSCCLAYKRTLTDALREGSISSVNVNE